METKILFKTEAQNALLAGVRELHDAVASTLGPRGHTVIIDKGYGVPHVTKDGVTVARAYDSDEPLKRMGATLVKMAAAKTCDEAGDGTTTATILSYALMSIGMQKMQQVRNLHQFKQGIQDAKTLAVEKIRSLAVKIGSDDIDRVRQIATISANGDDEIGGIVASAVENVGNDGVITVEESTKSGETTVEVTTGFQWEKGLVNPYFVTDTERLECVLDKPYVLVWGQNINYVQEILPIVQTVYTSKRALLIVAPNMNNDVLKFLITNVQQQNGLKACFVKAPGYGAMQKDLLEDLAVKVGATVVGDDYGHDCEAAGTDWLGECDRAVVSSSRTVIVGGAGKDEAVAARAESIRHQIRESGNAFDTEKYRERLSRLTGGAAVIYVGADSEVEMKERKDRVDDAIAATRAAVAEGYVAGGGMIEWQVASHLARWASFVNVNKTMDYCAGYETVIAAIKEHFRTLLRNSGVEPLLVEAHLQTDDLGEGVGYSILDEDFVNLMERGIIDPAKVTRVALENAVSVAVQFLSTSCAMADDSSVKGGNSAKN